MASSRRKVAENNKHEASRGKAKVLGVKACFIGSGGRSLGGGVLNSTTVYRECSSYTCARVLFRKGLASSCSNVTMADDDLENAV